MDQSNLPAAIGIPLSAALFALWVYGERLAALIRTHRNTRTQRRTK